MPLWNRVFLLAFGIAAGWTLVHYKTAPLERLVTFRTRLWMSAAAGGLLILWMGLSAWEGAGAGILVFMLGALTAYAANAKQINRPPDAMALSKLQHPTKSDPRNAVVLVALIEPLHYEGPADWSELMHSQRPFQIRAPHWLVAPFRYAAIRRAYQRMGGLHLLARHLEDVAERLQAHLGSGYIVRWANVCAAPRLTETLRELAQAGVTQVTLIPLEEQVSAERLSEQVSLARVREVGVRVVFAPPVEGIWDDVPPLEERLAIVMRGQPLTAPTAASDGIVSALAKRALRAH